MLSLGLEQNIREAVADILTQEGWDEAGVNECTFYICDRFKLWNVENEVRKMIDESGLV